MDDVVDSCPAIHWIAHFAFPGCRRIPKKMDAYVQMGLERVIRPVLFLLLERIGEIRIDWPVIGVYRGLYRQPTLEQVYLRPKVEVL